MPMPSYATAGSCCFDIVIRQDAIIAPQTLALLPTNLIITVPEGYMFIIVPRSSTPKKKGLLIPHGIGIVDQDYNGPKDEVLFQVYNFTEHEVSISRGERLAQGCLVPIIRPELVEQSVPHGKKNRGGVGSTG